jgi:hypothetical protein
MGEDGLLVVIWIPSEKQTCLELQEEVIQKGKIESLLVHKAARVDFFAAESSRMLLFQKV